MRIFFGLIACAAAAADPSADEVIRRALSRDRQSFRASKNYTFVERAVQKNLDSDGKVKSVKTRTYDITMLEDEPFRRLIAVDDRPLSPEQERKEQQRLRKSAEARRKETAEQRAARLEEEQKKREFTAEIPLAFELTLAGSETISGRDCYILDGVPRRGYKPRSRVARFFPHLKGRLWIDKEDYSLVRGEAEVIDTISYGLFLARIHKGTRMVFEQTRVNGEVWLPLRVHALAAARLGLVKKYNVEFEATYRDYRRFQADSRIVSAEEP